MTARFSTLSPPLYTYTSPGKQTNCFGFPFFLKCIKYKVACMCFSAINGSGPAYLSELLHVYTPSCTLCSFSDTHAENPTIQTQDSWFSHCLLLWTPHLENTTETCLMVNFLTLFLIAHFQSPPFLRSLAVILNFPAGWMIALPS